MRLYVDGVLVGSRADTTAGRGLPRLLARSVATTCRAGPASRPRVNFVGGVDEVAIYPTALTAAQIQAQYALRNGGGAATSRPVRPSRWAATGLTASFDGVRVQRPRRVRHRLRVEVRRRQHRHRRHDPSHTYAAAGTYTVTLTVTDNGGATAATTAGHGRRAAGVIASDPFNRTVVDGWGQADTGGTVDAHDRGEQLRGRRRRRHAAAGGPLGAVGLPLVDLGARSSTSARARLRQAGDRRRYLHLGGGADGSGRRTTGPRSGSPARHDGLPRPHGRRGRDHPDHGAAARHGGGAQGDAALGAAAGHRGRVDAPSAQGVAGRHRRAGRVDDHRRPTRRPHCRTRAPWASTPSSRVRRPTPR